MNSETLQWAVFCAVLVPLFVFGPGTAALLAMSFSMGLVALADRLERHG